MEIIGKIRSSYSRVTPGAHALAVHTLLPSPSIVTQNLNLPVKTPIRTEGQQSP